MNKKNWEKFLRKNFLLLGAVIIILIEVVVITNFEGDKTKLSAAIDKRDSVISNLEHPDITVTKTIPAKKEKTEKTKDGKAITLSTGKYKVGDDVEFGTYDVSAIAGDGNFFVYSATGRSKINEILGIDNQFIDNASINNVHVVAGDEIEIANGLTVHLTPNDGEEKVVQEAEPESEEQLILTYDEEGNETEKCSKNSINTYCSDLSSYDELKKEVEAKKENND